MTAHARLSECGSAALALAREGWPVFPCDHRLARCKAPLTEHGFKDTTTDPVQIEAWWRQFPNALIACPTGEAIGAWVLDLDLDPEKGLDGPAELARLEAVHGRLPQTVEASTPRGGRHLLFRWDATHPVTNSSGRLPDGLDVRGTGGYFIVWPSRREDGAEWRWECPPGFFDIAEAPAWLYELIRAKPERKPNGGAGGFGFRAQGGGAREAAWARAALEGCAADVAAEAKGKRNATLNACAYRLGRMIARGWLDRSEVELRLLAAGHASGLVADDGERAAGATITSGIEAGLREPHEDLGTTKPTARKARRTTPTRNRAHPPLPTKRSPFALPSGTSRIFATSPPGAGGCATTADAGSSTRRSWRSIWRGRSAARQRPSATRKAPRPRSPAPRRWQPSSAWRRPTGASRQRPRNGTPIPGH